MSDEGKKPLPKFGDWDVSNPASAEGFTVIFNKARNERKTGGKPEPSGTKEDSSSKKGPESSKSQSQAKKWFCCGQPSDAD